ncbi:MAG: hypothetical protein C0610_16705 [Desulfobacteraceae bacterium]|nr:MAG: hypothetical protein C0610_16705 [Desulfobacteraceae bacterium]
MKGTKMKKTKLVESKRHDGFGWVILKLPQAAPSAPVSLAFAWSGGGLTILLGSVCLFRSDRFFRRFSRARYRLSRIQYWMRLVGLSLNPSKQYRSWGVYYRCDHVPDGGVTALPNGYAAARWEYRHDTDDDCEVAFSYRTVGRLEWEEYEEFVADGGSYRRDLIAEAHEDGHPHCVYG